MKTQPVYIVGAKRTPIGAFLGALSSLKAPELGAKAIRAALAQAQIAADAIDEVYMGNVLSAGVGQAPARQASIAAGLSSSVPTTTLNKVCGSGLMAVMMASRALQLGEAKAVVAGGMESMSNAPYLLPRARQGYRMGHGEIKDAMILDGLWDPYNDFHMGEAGELCAREYDFSRDAQDEFARDSYRKALAALESGAFSDEIAGVKIAAKGGESEVLEDEEPKRAQLDKMSKLRPAFRSDGTITAANASKLNDGAAALVLVNEAGLEAASAPPLARIVASASYAHEPERFTTAPVGAIRRVLAKAELDAKEIDLFEVNEAFAVVAMACAREIGISPEKLNPRGGAVALGHPIGASGARVLVTLLHALKQTGKRRGLATLCIGGGEAVALVVERV